MEYLSLYDYLKRPAGGELGRETRDAKPITDSPYGWGSVVAITLGVIGVGILLLVREQGLFSCE